MTGTLFVVATPIGNLDDLTPRARAVLDSVGLIAAEDTRRTRRLLTHIGAKTPLTALHDFNEAVAADALIETLRNDGDVALVSDAGTPLVSDPGYRLVRHAQDCGVRVIPVPGASALTAALSAAGIATDRFVFEGFLPNRPRQRQARLDVLRAETRSLVFFEAVHRVADTLDDLAARFGPEREATLVRELTKMHEQIVRATLGGLVDQLVSGAIPQRGEFVLVVAGAREAAADDGLAETLLRELVDVLPGKQAAAIVARVTGEARNEVYQRMLELKE